jgi:hypothetical protein
LGFFLGGGVQPSGFSHQSHMEQDSYCSLYFHFLFPS